jgi:hypothetical protein
MGFATFSGPIRVGTVREGPITSANLGLLILAQTYTAPFGVILTSPAAQNMFTLPAGSKILRFRVEVVTALATATNCGLVIGKSGTANFFVTTFNTGATVGAVAQATVDTATVVNQTNNIGTTDTTVTGTFTAATGNATAGSIVVTVEYIQRLSDGTTAPTSFTA